MSYLMFMVVEILGLLVMAGTYKGIFSLAVAFLCMIVMLALSFHVFARDPRPDSTSIRMASFAGVLWYASVFSGKLFLEFRSWTVTLCAGLFMLLTITVAGFATWSVLERPLDYDVDEAE
jgi:hypothetical protein